jgi:hypothetical protein
VTTKGEETVKRAALAAAGAALAAALVATFASAAAPRNGRLIVSNPVTNVAASSSIHLASILAPGTYRTTIYVPAGYRAPGDVGTIGNNVGKGHVFVTQADGSRVTLNGQISVVNSAQYPDTGCTAVTGKHHEVWVLQAKQPNGTGTVTFPIFVDDLQSNPKIPATAAYTLQYCTGGLGLNITEVDLDLVKMFVNPSARGMYMWRAVYDPAATDGKTILSSDSVLAASAVPVNAQVSLKVNPVRNHLHWVTITGNVTAAKAALGHVKVQVYVGRSSRLALRRPKATVRTKADCSYRVTLRLASGLWYARAKASTPCQDITAGGGCTSADPNHLAGKGCVDATLAPFIVTSKPLKSVLR